MGIHEVVVATRNELTRRGWAQDGWVTPDGRVCMFGAYLCSQRLEVNYATTRAVSLTDSGAQDLARALGFRTVQATMLWNDAPGRTIDDLLTRLDVAITSTAPLPSDPLIGVAGYALVRPGLPPRFGAFTRAWRTAVAWIGFGWAGSRAPLAVRFTTRRHKRRQQAALGPAVPEPLSTGELMLEVA